MAYSIVITPIAEELLDKQLAYLIFRLNNEQAAGHLLDEISNIYTRIEENPFQFPESQDSYLKWKGYREAVVLGMNYKVIYRVATEVIYIMGVFHDLENYADKVKTWEK